ncbi:hypothetical protein [Streptomyces broussonetiae]|uniref:DUF2087 domain-containing protein n=1 Tax=Streptomyces broussonetiae TaxID=2686304 RepID=A0ABV5E5N8_9ACTN
MSARDRLHARLFKGPNENRDDLLDAYRAEELHKAADVLAPVYPGAAKRLRQLADQPVGKSSRPAADSTPGLTVRQQRLLDAIRTHGGEWTTRRVLHLYALTDPGVVGRGAARSDLTALARAGHLVLVDAPDNRHYVLHTRKDGAL